MGRWIAAVAEIGLDFDQAQDEALAVREPVDQSTADQVRGDRAGIACIEGSSKRNRSRHSHRIGKPTAFARVRKCAAAQAGRLEPPAGTADAR